MFKRLDKYIVKKQARDNRSYNRKMNGSVLEAEGSLPHVLDYVVTTEKRMGVTN